MTDRLVIEITGELPDAGKFGILAYAEEGAKTFAADLIQVYKDLELRVSVKAVRPGKKSAAQAVVEPAPLRRHTAE
jgi:hypothetical protein